MADMFFVLCAIASLPVAWLLTGPQRKAIRQYDKEMARIREMQNYRAAPYDGPGSAIREAQKRQARPQPTPATLPRSAPVPQPTTRNGDIYLVMLGAIAVVCLVLLQLGSYPAAGLVAAGWLFVLWLRQSEPIE